MYNDEKAQHMREVLVRRKDNADNIVKLRLANQELENELIRDCMDLGLCFAFSVRYNRLERYLRGK